MRTQYELEMGILVSEMPRARMDHGHAALVACFNGVRVAFGTTGLNDG